MGCCWTKATFVTGLLAKVIIIKKKIDPNGGEQPWATKAVVGVLRNSSQAYPSAPMPDGASFQTWTPRGHAEWRPSPVFLISREAAIMGPG